LKWVWMWKSRGVRKVLVYLAACGYFHPFVVAEVYALAPRLKG
jgi:hypothetical protein